MTFEIVIKNGTVVDGTGAPGYRADVALSGGRVAKIGRVIDAAARVIDAEGLVVAPGFIDPHTHYDAQICWDPYVTPTSWHGVTTVVMGNCGVGLAPCRPEARDATMWDVVSVEGIPFDVLKSGITWDWESFPDFMTAAGRRGSAINLAFLAPLTPFRHYVMGEAAVERAATSAETSEIASLLKQAMESGAVGWSLSLSPSHIGYQGRPFGSRLADRKELSVYALMLKEMGRGVIELALTSRLNEEEADVLDFLLSESGRPVTWNGLFVRDDEPESHREVLRLAEPLIKRGAIPQASCRPIIVTIDPTNPFVMASAPSFARVFNRSEEEQKAVYRDPGFRAAFRDDFAQGKVIFNTWRHTEVQEVYNPALKIYEGRSIADIAQAEGKDGIDVFLDIVLADNLRTQVILELFNAADEGMPEIIDNPGTLIGLSDGGAHVSIQTDTGYCTYLLGHFVREKRMLSLERAVQRISSEPADFFGLHDRGRLKPGYAADVTIFDPRTVGSNRRGHYAFDLPQGGKRMVVAARGIAYTIVNGKVLYDHGEASGTLPGTVLRVGARHRA